ncbi:hypothetical protein Cgig2_026964 [Carnegiea gigantea]|uniref:Probable zinc-ribbon domain-containing protein n=1 Tax=Carnegiea gigantea TaxID=171969 RepID=A0A9Q1QSY4_9CARY|nr:hypothetical protein Cgig2_026964 [Carnegiea gigantea]
MASRSPARSAFGDAIVSKSPTRESQVVELDGVDGDSPKSSTTERFLSDHASVTDWSLRSTSADRLPMRERELTDFDSDGVGKSPVSLRNPSKSPFREVGVQTPVSVRTRHVSQSPMRDLNGMGKPPVGPRNGDMPNSSMRGAVVSKCDENVEAEERIAANGDFGLEEEARSRKLWLPDDKHTRQSHYPVRRRSWGDRLGDEVDQISEGRESISGSEHGMTSEGSTDDPIHGVDLNKEIMHRDVRFRRENFGGYANARGSIDQWVPRRDGFGVEHKSFSASSSVADGPSNYHADPLYSYGDQRHNFVSPRRPASVQDLELERAQLLQQYKELKDQLSGSDNKRLSTLYNGPDDYSEDESWRFGQESLRKFAPDKSVRRRPHFNAVPVHDMGDLYSYHSPWYDDPLSVKMARWPQNIPGHHFLKRPVPGHIPGRSLDFDQDSLKSYNVIPRHILHWSLDFDHDPINSYLNETNYHDPACSCSLCCGRDWRSEDLPNSLADGVSVSSTANLRSSHSLNVERHVPWVYNPRMAQTNPRERPSHLANHHLRRARVTSLDKQLCYPIAGGSPFVLCCKCFRLLKLPGKLMQNQLQCGSCSARMSFDVQKGSLDLVVSQKKLNSVGSDSRFGKLFKGLGPKHRREMTATSTNLGSYDFDAAGCSFQSEPSVVSKGHRSSSSSADNKHCLSPSSSHTSRSSKEDCASDSASVRNSLPTSADKPLFNLVHPPTGSPLLENFEYSNCFRKLEAERKINDTREEKKVLRKDNSLEGSSDNVAIAREAEVHSHENSSTEGASEVEEDKAGETKDKRSPIASLMKWGFASKSVRPSPGRVEVYVNGRPIPHRGVKRAEKFAGPIQPGDYWYDSKAGFWGVMGHRCLGIIPPSIQEFSNFPMPENCSDGDTGVYVNGRELHKKDLDLLASRGLPTMSDKRYIIDISGKVVEEGTRVFVVNLGKLAPTVERNRCGYGMQVPEKLE